MTQVVECLTSKQEAPSSNTITTKIKRMKTLFFIKNKEILTITLTLKIGLFKNCLSPFFDHFFVSMSLEFLIPYYILDINPVAQKCYISHTIA
jgi:hypothetical protein